MSDYIQFISESYVHDNVTTKSACTFTSHAEWYRINDKKSYDFIVDILFTKIIELFENNDIEIHYHNYLKGFDYDIIDCYFGKIIIKPHCCIPKNHQTYISFSFRGNIYQLKIVYNIYFIF